MKAHTGAHGDVHIDIDDNDVVVKLSADIASDLFVISIKEGCSMDDLTSRLLWHGIQRWIRDHPVADND